MKQLSISILIILFTLFSCEDFEEIKENPNNVSETHPQLLLTKIEWDAFQVKGASPLFASRMLVQTDGEQSEQFYTWNRASFSDYNNLRNITKMMEEGQRIESPSYEALAKFFRAVYFYNLTLTFGDIPYSEALKGESEELYTPGYDSQKNVFTGILNELEEANNLITDDIIEGDIIFDGDAEKWKKLINSFRLKILISLSNQESDADLNIASKFANIVSNEPIMESLDDNGQLVFLDQDGNRYTEFNSSSYSSSRYMDSTFIQKLIDRKDPRLFIYSDRTGIAKEAGLAINDFNAYEGGNPIAPYSEVNAKAAKKLVSTINLRYVSDPTNEPHVVLGYPELQFILAEARVRGWINTSDAKTYYENGVKASFRFFNTYAENYAPYVDANAANTYLQEDLINFDNASTNEEKIERIVTQKYLQSFLQGGWTSYFEHLRTGYPSFLILGDATPPTRWMYPNDEYQYNGQNVSDAIKNQFGEGNDDTREIPWWIK